MKRLIFAATLVLACCKPEPPPPPPPKPVTAEEVGAGVGSRSKGFITGVKKGWTERKEQSK
jgi:hypothetical protein